MSKDVTNNVRNKSEMVVRDYFAAYKHRSLNQAMPIFSETLLLAQWTKYTSSDYLSN